MLRTVGMGHSLQSRNIEARQNDRLSFQMMSMPNLAPKIRRQYFR
jgi:hypothetical protein